VSKPSIFISYGRGDDHEDYNDPDKSFLHKLYKDLTGGCHDVWWDRKSMPARGLTFTDEIKSAVTKHDRLILLLGPHAVNSPYVTYEWRHALSLCKPIIPILLKRDPDIKDDKDQYQQIPNELKNYHTLNALGWADDLTIYDNMLEELDRVLSEKSPMGEIHNIPRKPPGYIQRDGFNDIQQQLLMKTDDETHAPVVIAPHEQVTTVQGAGGIGKTVLASAIGRSCLIRRHFTDGIFWVRLGKWEDVDVVSRQSALGLALGDKDTKAYMDAEGGRMRLSGLLRTKQALIILDDVWDSRQTRAFDALGQNCRLLITSRQRDLVAGVTAHKLNKLTDSEGMALIGGWLERDPEAHNPHEAEEKHILTLVDGYTLAVAIAGAKLANQHAGYTHASLIKRLEAGRIFKDLKLGRGETRNESLEVAIKLSYDDLSQDDQLRFRQLGVLAPSTNIDRRLIQAIWEDDEFDAEDALNRLVNAALLDRDESGRWEQHRILRAYAEALLTEDEETDAFARYVQYMTDLAQFDDLPMEDWDTIIGPDYPHIDYLGDTLTERYSQDQATYSELTADFIWSVKEYVYQRPVLRDGELHGLRWLELAYEIYEQTDDKSRQATILNRNARAWQILSELSKALHYYNQALPLHRELNDKYGEATTLNDMGSAWQNLGKVHKALDFYEQALPLRREVGDKTGEAGTLNNIGTAWRALGKVRKALDFYEQALPLIRKVGDKSGEASSLNNIAAIQSDEGHPEQAIETYLQAIEIVHDIGAVADEAGYRYNLGVVYAKIGKLNDAIQQVKQAIDLLQSIELPQASTGTKIEKMQADLRELKRRKLAQFKAPTPSKNKTTNTPNIGQQLIDQMVQSLKPVYQAQGEKGVRRRLSKQKVDKAKIETILSHLRQDDDT